MEFSKRSIGFISDECLRYFLKQHLSDENDNENNNINADAMELDDLDDQETGSSLSDVEEENEVDELDFFDKRNSNGKPFDLGCGSK